ncbi:MAG: glycosyltransferase family 4 protein [Candidatus Omnitrophica bacterium]|nr:glycosyltransferase family 4 protein [Candidatus Omnitrophota bacterium]MCM8777981.1 glycosyltransferase family 4 protein [Candidatus Omnitrophota bacterium]
MRIAIDCDGITREKTGIGWYKYYLISNLAKIDKENQYLIYNILYRGFKEEIDKIKFYLPERDNFRKKIYRFNSYYGRKYLPIELFTGKIDILHNLDHSNVSSLTLTAKRVVTIHDIIPLLSDIYANLLIPEEYKKGRKFLMDALFKSDRIITVSYASKNDMIKYLSIDPSSVSVIYLGKDEIFYPREKRNDMLDKYKISKKFILSSPVVPSRKNFARILLSFEKIRKNNDCQIVSFGKIKKYGEWFKIFERLPSDIKEDIIFTGYVPVEDLPYLYSAAEFFIYPSLYEGFGLPVLEAMACGCPVITSNTSSLTEVAGDAGILINPYNVDEMAENMERLLSDEKLRERLKVKGLERAKQFTWERTAKETIKVYEEVYNGR